MISRVCIVHLTFSPRTVWTFRANMYWNAQLRFTAARKQNRKIYYAGTRWNWRQKNSRVIDTVSTTINDRTSIGMRSQAARNRKSACDPPD
jgi:hypothetical protein